MATPTPAPAPTPVHNLSQRLDDSVSKYVFKDGSFIQRYSLESGQWVVFVGREMRNWMRDSVSGSLVKFSSPEQALMALDQEP